MSVEKLFFAFWILGPHQRWCECYTKTFYPAWFTPFLVWSAFFDLILQLITISFGFVDLIDGIGIIRGGRIEGFSFAGVVIGE